MLGKPEAGMSAIKIGTQYIGAASCINDVPMETLDAFLRYYQGAPFQVTYYAEGTYDAEGYHFGIITFDETVYIVNDKDKIEHIHTQIVKPENNNFGGYAFVEKVIPQLAKECVNDIRKYIDGWVDWGFAPNEKSERKQERRRLLLEKANLLEDFL